MGACGALAYILSKGGAGGPGAGKHWSLVFTGGDEACQPGGRAVG